MFPIPMIFGALLTSCTEEKDIDTGVTDTGIEEDTSIYQFFNDCPDSDYCWSNEYDISVSAEDLAPFLDANGQITEAACLEFCGPTGPYGTCSCAYRIELENEYRIFECGIEECYVGRSNGDICKESEGKGETPLAQWAVQTYHAEASSVAAFLQIRRELENFGAPKSLQKRCIKAASEEVRHARIMASLIQQLGAKKGELSFGQCPERSLLAFALDNVREGCVNEAFAALCTLYQGKSLPDSRLKDVMQSIGKDEIQHVALSYDIHHWCMQQLGTEEQELLRIEHRKALSDLVVQASQMRSVMPVPPLHLVKQLTAQLKIA